MPRRHAAEEIDPGADPAGFIAANTRLTRAPGVPEIRLYTAHAGSGLRRLEGPGGKSVPPYWAFPWAGGLALARHVLAQPETVAGLRVLDFGAGSGIVGIAAGLAGAKCVASAETDRFGAAALRLNAEANRVGLEILAGDPTAGPPPAVDLVLAGDVFYDKQVARRASRFFARCVAAGIAVLVGDPGRAFLPRARLTLVAEYQVADFGDPPGAPARRAGVFRFKG